MATAKTTETTKATETTENGKTMVKIRLPILPRDRDTGPMPVSVNGEKYWIPRGIAVEVPDYIAEVIEHAETEEANAEQFIRGISS